jgi:hypothetical protein
MGMHTTAQPLQATSLYNSLILIIWLSVLAGFYLIVSLLLSTFFPAPSIPATSWKHSEIWN